MRKKRKSKMDLKIAPFVEAECNEGGSSKAHEKVANEWKLNLDVKFENQCMLIVEERGNMNKSNLIKQYVGKKKIYRKI